MRLDGPRTDIEDITRFWINAHGAPVTIRNAHGRETLITYDTTWPALATKTRSVAGLVTTASYNDRGLVTATTLENPLGDGDTVVTTYKWNATWNMPDTVRGPNGVATTYTYDASGNVATLQVGPDIGRRVTASYYPTGHPWAGMYRASTVPVTTERDSVVYDAALGNVKGVRNRLGVWSYSDADALGRVRKTWAALDAAAAAGDTTVGRWRRDSTWYDLADQPVRN